MNAARAKGTDVDPHRRGWILAALMFAMMLAAMDTTIVSTAIPQIVDEVIDALHGADLSMPARQYLREAIGAATGHVYLGVSVIAVCTPVVLLVAPRRFRLADS